MEEIFNEKYRPKTFDEVVGLDPELPKLIGPSMPHLLFEGSAGTGKTTVAKIIIRELNAEALILNASKDRGIEVIREKIEPFATKASSQLKIVFLDEFDATTPAFQTALRNFMETHSRTTRFIATCNYLNKVIDPLRSRFSIFKFNRYDPKNVQAHLQKIVERENIQVDAEVLQIIVKRYRDDIRGMINLLNKYKNKKILKEDVSQENTVVNILSHLKQKKWFEIRQALLGQQLDYSSLIDEMDTIIFNHKDIPETVKSKATVICAKYQFEMYFTMNKELTFAAFMYSLSEVLQW